MYQLVFSSQQPKAKSFREHCCNVMFPQIRQQLANKIKAEHQQAITGRDDQIEVFLSLQIKKNGRSINKPLKKKMQHLHCSVMIYKTVTIRFRPSSMKTWHCKHKEMYIRPSYKEVKIKSVTLLSIVMLLCK